MDRRRIEVSLTIRGYLPSVTGDSDLLHRLLVNVLVNAADSMGEGGRIEITAFTDRDPSSRVGMVHIQIADSGAGIPPEVIARVFERGSTTKGGGEAHGFGLSICREIIEMHGGEIQLSSVLRRARPFSSRSRSLNRLVNTFADLPTLVINATYGRTRRHLTPQVSAETVWHVRRTIATLFA